jgi:putative ABC transport system substrate-binding protein
MIRRRDFITLLGGVAAARPLAAHAQQALPLVGFINGGGENTSTREVIAFRKGLSEAGYLEGKNVTVEYHWFEGEYGRLPTTLADLVRRGVAVIAAPGFPPGAVAAKAATTSVPIIFGVGTDPVKLGLVASFARPGGNVTGINFFAQEATSKRLAIFHDLVPKAVRLMVMVNPANASSMDGTLREVQTAAPALGFDLKVIRASTPAEIDEAFEIIRSSKFDALFVAGDGFFYSRRAHLATLAARDRIPASYSTREFAAAGGLMSYGANLADMFRQVGIYTGSVLRGMKPSDLPVVQSDKLEFVLNVQTAKTLAIELPPSLLVRADEVNE